MEQYRIDGIEKLKKILFPKHVVELEEAVYKYTIEYANRRDVHQYIEQLYNTKMADMCFNLEQRNSPMLLVKVVKDEIPITHLPYAAPQTLNEQLWDPITKKNEYIEYIKNNREVGEYVCKKCKEKKCTDVSMQARSSDEPMSIFISCLNCGYKYRIN